MMWTNVFKLGGLNQISWFQFLPHEFDFSTLPDKSVKLDQKDALPRLVLSAHQQLQNEGFLSTWTNSFVGPWDPSQGLHNPDEKIKLWLFLPGQHSSVAEKAQLSVSRLRVLASGLWVAPGDSEEVAAALSQALRNCIERALRGLSYVRFGDVFSKHHPFIQNEELFRRGQPVAEFIFAATEETIFVHVIISAKHVRALSSGDIESFINRSTRHANERISVVVSPHGMRGKLTGCCPSNLVKQVYLRPGKFRGSNGIVGLPYHASQGPGPPSQLMGQNCYVEVTLGCLDKTVHSHKNSQPPGIENPAIVRGTQIGSSENLSICDKVFVYPAEAVLFPVKQTSFARSALKRFWMQNWAGPSVSGCSIFMHCDEWVDSRGGSLLEPSGTRSQHGNHSSSNSNCSSNCSISSSSSESDRKTLGAGDLEADADSLMSRESGLSSLGQPQNADPKIGSKRPRTGTSESFGQAGVVLNPSTSDYGTMEVNNTTSIVRVSNDQVGSYWGWDDDDRGMEMDIQALLSEFGGFGDFFENDTLPFGEPPGTAESHELPFHASDGGELGSSPCNSLMDVSDQLVLPVGFPTFDSYNHPPAPAPVENSSKNQEAIKGSASASAPALDTCTMPPLRGEFDHVLKAEALMTFAPEYGAVETPQSEISSVILRSPYVPKSCKVDSASSSNNYVYSATPPSPFCDGSDEKSTVHSGMKACTEKNDSNSFLKSEKYYTHVDKGNRQQIIGKFTNRDNHIFEGDDGVGSSQFSVLTQTNSEISNGSLREDNFLLSSRTVLATETECLLCQATMCRLRHTLLSPSKFSSAVLNGLPASGISNQVNVDPGIMVDNISSKSEFRKKETIPVRIAGDIDGGVLDGPLSAPVGVWRSVGMPKVAKTSTPTVEVCPSMPHNSFIEESMLSYGLRQPLQELLDGISFLVQQATSFVDVSLDADCGDGPYGLLALQEQCRRGFSCGPSMVHAGCGGVLASCHSLDIAGVELLDPLSVDVQASLTISLLQSDMKAALKSAFSCVDGPLSVIDWCKGRNQPNELGITCNGFSSESTASVSDCRDSSSTVTLSVGDPMSPSLSSVGGASSQKDGTRGDEASERHLNQDTSLLESDQQLCLRFRPTVSVVPFPSILVGYQDDWLKTSVSSLQVWEKAPLEPYATPKHMNYYVVCPNIDPLITAASDFFLQLGTVYETCKLGTHAPQSLGNEMEIDSGKNNASGFVLLDCPQSMKIDTNNASMLGSISDYFLSLSNGWDLTCFLKTLSKVLKTLKLGSSTITNAKERNSVPCTVVYVICPFPEPLAVLQTVVESSIAIGSIIRSSDKERRSMMNNQVAKALSYSAAVDESFSNVLTLTGFSIPKLVLQIVTVDAIFRVTSPALNELIILKETAFTVYNKARRIARGVSTETLPPSLPGRSHSVLMQMASPGMWKDCVGSRIVGPSLQRENELDASLRPGTWDNSWHAARSGGLGCDPNRTGDVFSQDDIRCLFEPLFILAEPGSLDRGFSPFLGNPTFDSSKPLSDDCASNSFVQSSASSGSGDNARNTQSDALDSDGFASVHQKPLPSLHCCYGWTEDWRWMVCIWTDSRGELLDSYVYPFGGISSRQDTKGLQSLFIQILQQGCQILQACSPDISNAKPRDLVITRVGCYFELECQEWQKALYSAGGSDVKKWSVQLRRSFPDGIPPGSNGTSLQQQEMSLIQDRALPSSPSPLSSPHPKSSSFMKGGMGQPSSRKQMMGGHAVLDNSKGILQWVQNISFVSVSIDHSLQLVYQADSTYTGSNQGSAMSSQSGYLEGYTPVKSLGSTSASYVLIPSPSMRFLPPAVLQLPTCLTAESPPLAHLLHSKGSAIPLSTGFVVSQAVPSVRKDSRTFSKEERPSVLSVNLIDYYGSSNLNQEKSAKPVPKVLGKGVNSDAKDFEIETHLILESLAAELHALSWMTVSPAYLERRTALPFHCDMVLRLRRLLHFADKELSRLPDKARGS
ncbi:mediator of RNA polymerase II transcription subunit 13 isoform X4 [Henckelia pumila]|uniref:mediator of RNA polymerase II transcription subunit 13 isoform X4 n=1 Tax=Henckelia pumila TaxID=405737 RepID=UPI003C6E3C60